MMSAPILAEVSEVLNEVGRFCCSSSETTSASGMSFNKRDICRSAGCTLLKATPNSKLHMWVAPTKSEIFRFLSTEKV